MRNISAAGLAFIKYFEGFRPTPYQDSNHVWTIGYGHTEGVGVNTAAIDEPQAENFLRMDLANAQSQILRLVSVLLNDNQYAALVSLVYNVGNAPLKKTLGRLLESGDYAGAADEFPKWVYAGSKISDGLVRRRAAEKVLFLK